MTVWIVTNGAVIDSVWDSHGAAAARAVGLNETLTEGVLPFQAFAFEVRATG